MSSWKRASAQGRRKHLERSQHSSRMHLGLLEKHRDYKLRSEDRHAKQNIITDLKAATVEKNPDEFFHNMINSEFKAGSHTVKLKSHDKKKLERLHSLDKCHVEYWLNIERRRSAKLCAKLGLPVECAVNDEDKLVMSKRYIFVDSSDSELDYPLVNLKTPLDKCYLSACLKNENADRCKIRNDLEKCYQDRLEQIKEDKFHKDLDIEPVIPWTPKTPYRRMR
ncbi:hypothetical protein GJ496_011486 [Pomphorhynchus laevis]|nr:hypothetical protein GJ496_011486 [Pomphorhynchus laevis]